MKRWLASGLGFLLAWTAPHAVAQNSSWNSSDRVRFGTPVAAPSTPAASLGLPSAIAEAPVAVQPAPIQRVAYRAEAPPSPAAVVFRMQAPDYDPPPPFRPPDSDQTSGRSFRDDEERFLGGAPRRPPTATSRPREGRRTSFGLFGEGGIDGSSLGQRAGSWFESDHCFDSFISPITNPFLFEDPRALTEVRPIFFYQRIPTANPMFRGGNAEFYGAQLRVAVTDRLSFVLHELGGVSIHPAAASGLPSASGFAELHIGPKFTFLRSVDNQAIGAAGLIFQIPNGPARVYQDTGSFSMTPYVSLAKNVLPTKLGSFNVMDTLGYTVRTDGQRSDYFYNSFHFDWDVGNRHILYPLIELNWFHYTRSGTARNFGFEGADLANIGSTGVGNTSNLNIAVGARYKFTERAQVGLAAEFPLLNRQDMNKFRLTIDFILRY